MNFIQQYLELIPSYPFVIQVSLWFIFINAIAIMIFMISAVFIRRNKRLSDELDRELHPKNMEFFNKILSSDDQFTNDEVLNLYVKEIENVSKRGKLKKKIYPPMIQALEDLVSNDVELINNKNYLSIIRGLRIEEYLYGKLKFTNLRTKLRTFQTFATLKLTAPDSTILPYTHSKNIFLRKESRNSYLGISNNDPFKFFNQADNSLNQWDNIALMQQLENHHKNNLPNFNQWIKYSQNSSQLLFVIKAVSHFNQENAIPSLLELLNNQDHQIRKESMTALGNLKAVEAEQQMMEMYNSQPQQCQEAIVKSILEIDSGKGLDFLKKSFYEENKLGTRKLIAEAIYKYNEEGRQYIQELEHTETGFNKLIIEHISNPLIASNLKSNLEKKETVYNPSNLSLNIN